MSQSSPHISFVPPYTVSTMEQTVKVMLTLIGENPERTGLKETPIRVAKAWKELFFGYQMNPAGILKTFEKDPDDPCDYNEIILSKNIEFTSFCEHHMLPFMGVAHVAYIPENGTIVGLSKLARLVEVYAKRLQVQERMTIQIASALMEHLKPKATACIIEAKHLCQACRGVQKATATMMTSHLTGAFMNNPSAKAELFAMIRN